MRRRLLLLCCLAAAGAVPAILWCRPRGYAHANLAPPFAPIEFSPDAASFAMRGVVQHDPSRAHPGYHLFDPLGDTRAHLLDMHGNIVHTWSYIEPLPGGPPPMLGKPGSRWLALDVLPDGSLILIHDHDLVMRLSWYSELIGWHRVPAHHDVAVAPDGTLCLWASDVRPYRGRGTLFSRLVFLSPDLKPLGTGLCTADLVERFPCPSAEAELASSPRGRPRPVDYYHENAVSVIGPSALPPTGAWTPGNLLVCLRNIDRLMVLDRTDQRVLWEWGAGVLEAPHHPRLLPNGHILVFDNGPRRGYSRVLELDPVTRTIAWSYPLSGNTTQLYSELAGAAQRLDNGNTLITESDRGRVIEVTPEGEIVWEFLQPVGVRMSPQDWHRARLYRLQRYPVEWFAPRLAAGEGRPGPHPVWWE